MNAWLERQPSRRYAVIMFVLIAMAWVLAMYVGYWLGYWLSGAARDHLSNAAGFSAPTIDLRGVQVQGTARCIEDPAAVREIGRHIAVGMADATGDALEEYVEHAARKRVGYAVEPQRIVSWDHSKLLPAT